jgi:hypothetical protein
MRASEVASTIGGFGIGFAVGRMGKAGKAAAAPVVPPAIQLAVQGMTATAGGLPLDLLVVMNYVVSGIGGVVYCWVLNDADHQHQNNVEAVMSVCIHSGFVQFEFGMQSNRVIVISWPDGTSLTLENLSVYKFRAVA